MGTSTKKSTKTGNARSSSKKIPVGATEANATLDLKELNPILKIEGLAGLDDQQVILALKDEVVRLRESNAALSSKVESATMSRVSTPDDFASAVSHSLDSLQSKLGKMKNPVCNFAVKQFSLETNVHVQVTQLGTVDYRFVGPFDDVDPGKLSKLKLELIPLPKKSDQSTWNSQLFTPFIGVEEIQGIGEKYREKLNKNQIYTLDDLLTASTRVRSKTELAALVGVDRERLGEWTSHAELMTVRTVDGHNAQILFEIGYHSLELLAAAEPADLTAKYNQRVTKLGHATLKPIDESQAKDWIEAAAAFAKM